MLYLCRMSSTKQPTYGLVLSGGGVRGIAHLGVLKALEEHGISLQYLAGASAGAIVASFYAAGHSWTDILHFFKTTSMFSWQNYAYRKPGLLDTDKFDSVFAEYLPEDDFSVLKKELFVSTTDIGAGRNVIFNRGPLRRAVLASSAFPIVLSPILIDGVYYADGAITNNFPVETLLPHCDIVIGSYVNPISTIDPALLKTSKSVFERAFNIGMAASSVSKFSQCDILIAPPQLNDVGMFSLSRIDEVFQIGYETATQVLEGSSATEHQ